MADNVDIRVRVQGARKAAAEAKTVGRSVGGIGDSSTRAARGTDRLAKSQGRGRRSMVAIGTAAKYGGLALGAGLFVGLKKSIGAFEESRQIVAQTGAVLKSTGGAANVTGRDVDSLTGALMRKTAIDDEQIRRGANMLLTFTRIRNEAGKGNKIFNRTTVAATDMAAALGTDAAGSAMMLGKAMNDPTKGLSRLMRVGVTFSQSQQDQIKKLQESGDMLGAQKVILREVTKEFGGSAAAQKTPLKQLSTSFGELAETVGAGVAPAVDKGAKKLSKFVTQMQTGKGAGGRFVVTLRELWTEAKPIVTWLGRAAVNVGKFVGKHPELAKVAAGIGAVALAVKALRFARALTGVDKLIGGLRRVGQTKAGQRAVEAISGQLSTLPARSKTALGKTRNTFRSTMGSVGRTGGTAAATGIITNTGSGVTKSARGGRLRGSMIGAGRLLGPAMGLALAAPLIDEMDKKIQSWARSKGIQELYGSDKPSQSAGDITPDNPIKSLLKPFGGAKGGLVTPGGIKAFGAGGIMPRGEDTLAALRFGEMVVPREVVASMTGGGPIVVRPQTRVFLNRREIAIAFADDDAAARARA